MLTKFIAFVSGLFHEEGKPSMGRVFLACQIIVVIRSMWIDASWDIPDNHLWLIGMNLGYVQVSKWLKNGKKQT